MILPFSTTKKCEMYPSYGLPVSCGCEGVRECDCYVSVDGWGISIAIHAVLQTNMGAQELTCSGGQVDWSLDVK